jgi:hypothetical protein
MAEPTGAAQTGSTPAGTAPAPIPSYNQSTGLSKDAIIVIGVVVPIAFIATLITLALYFLQRRRGSRTLTAVNPPEDSIQLNRTGIGGSGPCEPTMPELVSSQIYQLPGSRNQHQLAG